MLWQRTPVYDPASGKTLYVRHLSAHQPDIEREIYRAAVCEQEIGHTAVKEVVVGKIAGRWTVYQSAEGRAEPTDHPFLNRYENDYIAIVRSILAMLDDQYELAVIAAVETDSNDRWELAAFTQYRARAGCSPSFFPDETALDFIPGSRMVERNADTFPLTMGLTAEDGCIPGEFEMTVGLSSLSLSYEVDDWKLSIESTLHKGKWVHTTTMSAPRPDVNIIDALKFESLAPREKLVFLSDHSPFDHEFPKIAGGQVPVISLFDEGQNLVFGLESSEVR